MSSQISHGHSVSRLTAQIVWSAKYRYSVLKADLRHRIRSLLIQMCESGDVEILKGVLSKDHVHMHIQYCPSLSLSDLI